MLLADKTCRYSAVGNTINDDLVVTGIGTGSPRCWLDADFAMIQMSSG